MAPLKNRQIPEQRRGTMWEASKTIGHDIHASDGAIGSLDDLLFDDTGWTIRWAVIDTGTWLPGRRVLLPFAGLAGPLMGERSFTVDLTREQVENAPGLDSDAPVSRQLETEIHRHYSWPPYWDPNYSFPLGPAGIGGLVNPTPDTDIARDAEPAGDPHLRSTNEVTGYHVAANDGDIGHVEDFAIEEESASIRYLMVDTRNWWPGKVVLIAPEWLREISWAERKVHIDLSREQIRNSLEFDRSTGIRRPYEESLHGHYGRPPYWV